MLSHIVILAAAVLSLISVVDAADTLRIDTSGPSVQKEILFAHNYYRENAIPLPANLSDLTWSTAAQATANIVVASIASTCSLQHSASSTRRNCGENLALSSIVAFPWDLAVGLWGDERRKSTWKFGCSADSTFTDWGHYSQVVAQRTKTVGCAAAKCTSKPNLLVFVCHYCPPGNISPLNKPYTPKPGMPADCAAPNPNFPLKPRRTSPPTRNLQISTTEFDFSSLSNVTAAQSPPPPPPLQEPDGGNSIDVALPDTKQLILFKHNEYRRTAVPQPTNLVDLVWNKDASTTATTVVKRLAEQCTIIHSQNNERIINQQQCGENIGFLSGPALTTQPWAKLISVWGDERQSSNWQYGCSSNNSFSDWGHYAQVVSDKTQSVGCAAQRCARTPAAVIFVCHYCAAGNYPPFNMPYKTNERITCAPPTLGKDAQLADAVVTTTTTMVVDAPMVTPTPTPTPPSSPVASLASALALRDVVLADATTSLLDTTQASVQSVVLATHNQYRHEVCPRALTPLADLTWDYTAATTTAQAIANRLASSGGCRLMHSQTSERNNCGENLGFLGGSVLSGGSGGIPPWQTVVSLWGNERDKFTYAQSTLATFSDYGHYTQVVWSSTVSVGCAAAVCASGSLPYAAAVFVCHYCPAGNFPPINQPYPADPASPTTNCGSIAPAATTTTTTTTTSTITAAAPTTTTTSMTTTMPPATTVWTAPPTPPPTTTTTSTATPTTTTTPAPTPPSTTTPSALSTIDTSNSYTQDLIVTLHNSVRQAATSPLPAASLAALTWNSDLASAAALVLSNTALMQNFQISCAASSPNFHAIANPIQLSGRICTANAGASITQFDSSGTPILPWQQVIQGWASDKARFQYGCSDPTLNFDSWGRYTQMVDGTTTEIGCAASACSSGSGGSLQALMFCVYCDSAKSKTDYALNKPYDTNDVVQCNGAGTTTTTTSTTSTTTSTTSTTSTTTPTSAPTTAQTTPTPTTTSSTTTTTTTSAPPAIPAFNIDTSQASVQNFLLNSINLIRAGAQPVPLSPVTGQVSPLSHLSWNSQIIPSLQQNANSIAQAFCRPNIQFAPTMAFSASPNTCGVNAAVVPVGTTSDNPLQLAINQWTAGQAQFRFGCSNPNTFNMWGSYTQMLGQNTRTLGCATVQCQQPISPQSYVVVLCGFCSAGNINSQLNQPYSGRFLCQKGGKVPHSKTSASLLLPFLDLRDDVKGFVMPEMPDETTTTTKTTTTIAPMTIPELVVTATLETIPPTPPPSTPTTSTPAKPTTSASPTMITTTTTAPTMLVTATLETIPPPTPTPTTPPTPAETPATFSSTTTPEALLPPIFINSIENVTFTTMEAPTPTLTPSTTTPTYTTVSPASMAELTCPTTTLIQHAITPWMALPNYNRCIIFVRGPTGRGKLQQCASVAKNGSLLHADSEALKSLILLLREKLADDASSVTYEISPVPAIVNSTRQRRQAPPATPEDWLAQITSPTQQLQRQHSNRKNPPRHQQNNNNNNDFRSLLARTSRDRKFIDALLQVDPSIEQRALSDPDSRAAIASIRRDARRHGGGPGGSDRGGDSSALLTATGRSTNGRFVSPLVERFLQLMPADECNFVDDYGFQHNDELACGIYQWTGRHGYICEAPLGTS